MVNQEHTKLKFYNKNNIQGISQIKHISRELIDGILLAAEVLPFRVTNYVIENTINWNNIPDDPVFQMTFPLPAMLKKSDFDLLAGLSKYKDNRFRQAVYEIRKRMNPNPSEQANNRPLLNDNLATGIQHKYPQTVLFFPAHGQICHSYCSFCFRWSQFVQPHYDDIVFFSAKSSEQLTDYLRQKKMVTDVLITGGDPMVMNTQHLENYINPLLLPEFEHIQTIRIGTKALSYWPRRFLTDPDSDDLFRLIDKVTKAGKHFTLMVHINHLQEIETPTAIEAINRLRNAGVIMRHQSPILRHINDSSMSWQQLLNQLIRLGIIPYYMFIERDTGPYDYFSIPLKKALDVYQGVMKNVSGLSKTMRGPIMSAAIGKIELRDIVTISEQDYFLLHYLQARDRNLVNKHFLAKYKSHAKWITDLELIPSTASQIF